MFRRSTTQTRSDGRVRKVTTALLLAAMFVVPLSPMGSATNPSAAAFTGLSNDKVGSTTATYNFTYTSVSPDDAAVNLSFPSGFDLSSATVSTDDGGSASKSAGTSTSTAINITGLNQGAGAHWVNIQNIGLPRDAESSFTVDADFFNTTAGDRNGTVQNIAFSIKELTFTISVDTGKTILGAGATTDYVFDVSLGSDNAEYEQYDNLTFTFPSGFDLSDATIGSNEASGQKIKYTFTGSEAASFEVTIEDVVNPSVSTDTSYDDISAVVETTASKTIAQDTFDIDIVATDIDVVRTGTSTIVEEGKSEDDSVKVTLASEPEEDVIVSIDGGDQLTVDDDELTFTSANWDTAQTVKITAVDDSAVEGTSTGKLTFTSESDDDNYDKLSTTFTVDILDNDEGIVLIQLDEDDEEDDETIVTEGSSTGDRYQVYLATEPEEKVTITIDVDEGLEVDDDELTFTISKWDDPQVIEVTSDRNDDEDYQDDVELTITHTAESDDTDYDGATAELTVILEDDEHPALGLTDDQIRRANELVELTLTEEDDGILVEWDLPTQDDLDDIFDSDGEIEIAGVQVLTSNSPYTIAETFEDGDTEFEEGEWLHEFDDGASLRTTYLVTMYFNEDVGLWEDDDVPNTNDEGYEGDALRDALLPWWGWILVAVGGVVLVALILAAIVAAQNRKAFDMSEWDDEDDEQPASKKSSSKDEEPVAAKGKARKYDLECPVCDHHFSVKGVKPLDTECPNCGAKGVLN